MADTIAVSNQFEICLFIGGPSDGQRHKTDRSWKQLAVKAPDKEDPQKGSKVLEIYNSTTICGPREHFRIFIHNSLSLDDALGMLVERYGPIVKSKEPLQT